MTSRPNILWYCTDQQRFDTIGALGNPHVRTPAMDSLVGDGVAFTHAYCQSPICTPSRSSFMTGLYSSRVHNTRNGNESFPPWPPLITRLIADAGYECGLIGKFHLQSAGRQDPTTGERVVEPRLDDGFSFWKYSHAPRDDWRQGHDYAEWVHARGGDLNTLRASPGRVPPELHQTTWASERAIEFITSQRSKERPWLLNINIYAPHPPFIPSRAYAERFDAAQMPGPHYRESDVAQQEKLRAVDFQNDRESPERLDPRAAQARYYAMIAQIDDQLARILAALEQAGQAENTVVIFTSDHGEMLGDHGLMYKGCRFYEGLVRVPLIFRWPGRFQAGLRSGALVELLDLSATLLDLCGVERPGYFQGRSLVPIASGATSPAHHRDFVRCEYFEALPAYFRNGDGTYATMHRTGRYKLCLYHGLGVGELYDLQEDPWEFNNRWDDPAHRTTRERLLHASFDAHVLLTTDVGSRQIAAL